MAEDDRFVSATALCSNISQSLRHQEDFVKSLVFVLSLTIVLLSGASGTLFSQDRLDITGPPINSWDGGTKVTTGGPITWTINFRLSSNMLTGMTNGFRIFLSDVPTGLNVLDPGPGFAPMTYNLLIDMIAFGFDGGFFVNSYGVNGFGVDTIGFGGFTLFAGIPVGAEADVYEISTEIDHNLSGSGLYLCLDSTWYPPGGQWLWATIHGAVQPYWGGPYCYEIRECCVGNRGNIDLEVGPGGPVDVTDLSYLVSYLFNGFTGLPCSTVGNVDGLTGPAGPVDVADLTYLVAYMFGGGPEPPACPE